MPRFARIVDARLIDVYDSDSAATLEKNMGVTGFIQVNDDSLNGDIVNADGSYSHPPSPAPAAPKPVPLSRYKFEQLCLSAGGMSLVQLGACHADPALGGLWVLFDDAPELDRDDPMLQQGLAALDAAGYLPNHASAVTTAWPTA